MNRSYPPSCCSPDIIEHISKSKTPTASAVMNRNDDGSATATFTGQLKNTTGDLTIMDPWNHVAGEAEAKADDMKTVTVCTAIYQQVPYLLHHIIVYLRQRVDQ